MRFRTPALRNLTVLAATLACAASGIAQGAAAPRQLSYPQLVDRLTDLAALAEPPAKGETTGLASSYDRSSTYDAATDRYLNWGANGDGGGLIRMEGNEAVLAEISGPGCLWRIWSATAGGGHVKIYLDGSATPAVDLPFSAYFDGQHAPFTRPDLVYVTSAKGFNNYTPIPFQKSCRIVADKGWGAYYHFTYTRFPVGTQVPTFALPLAAGDEAALDRAESILAACGAVPASSPGLTETKQVVAAPGQTSTVCTLPGAGAVTGLRIKVQLPADPAAQERILRELALRFTWDGAKEPAVWTPFGDFFGNSWGGAIPHQCLPNGVTADGIWYSQWYMPFGAGAVLAVDNDGTAPVRMTWEVTHAPLDRTADELLRFHAKWHVTVLPPRADRRPDWTLLVTEGAGRYVGTQLHIWNPRPDWWGEGDEKFFVDGEKFPSTFGTGSEDYFGFAWSSTKTFVRPYHSSPYNQTYGGHVSVNRWHISDNVPFGERFEGAIEKYFGDDIPCRYDAVAFWYLSAGGLDPFGPRPLAERMGPWPTAVVRRDPEAIGGKGLKVLEVHPLKEGMSRPIGAPTLGLRAGLVDDDWLFAWRTSAPGGDLHLGGLAAPAAGQYRLEARLVSERNCGIVQLALDGKPVGKPLDLYAPQKFSEVEQLTSVDLGTMTLAAGPHVLSIEQQGKSANSTGYWFMLADLKLVPVR